MCWLVSVYVILKLASIFIHSFTSQERQARDPTLGARIAMAYARVQHRCPVATIDASQSPEDVLAAAIASCRAAGL
jgi:hypothetical protein